MSERFYAKDRMYVKLNMTYHAKLARRRREASHLSPDL
jgi:hypothetical protein